MIATPRTATTALAPTTVALTRGVRGAGVWPFAGAPFGGKLRRNHRRGYRRA